MKEKIKMPLLRFLGIVLIILGVLGLFLPFLQGIATLILGVYLLTLGHPTAHTRIRTHLSRTPKLLKVFNSVDEKIRRWLHLPH